ncbi:MAG: metallophosphoesterase [Clostridia bacterium]|nr:metallophosphoesterase [Clostridia bacterium]
MKRRCLSIILACSMIMSMLVLVNSMAVSAATPSDGVMFGPDDMFYVDSMKDAPAPLSYETWIYIPSDATYHTSDSSRFGTVFSSYSNYATRPYVVLGIRHDSGKYYPQFEWSDVFNQTNTVRTYNFTEVSLPKGAWTHLAFVLDPVTGNMYCYKNGALAQTKTTSASYIMYNYGSIDERVTDNPIVIGNDNRRGQPYNFLGKLGSLSFYIETLTAAEVKAHYENGVTGSEEGLLSHWDFAATDIGKNIADKSPNGYDLSYSKEFLEPNEVELPTDYSYTMMVIGDTQFMVEDDVNNGTDYTSIIYKWIADNAGKLKTEIVMGVGDITNNGNTAQNLHAYDAMIQLNGIVPYTVVRGNHDYYSYDFGLGFGVEDYLNQFEKNGGLMEENCAENTFYKFTAPNGDKWLVLNLDWSPTDEEIAWGCGIIEANPDYQVIIVTHQYLFLDGTTVDTEDYSDGTKGTYLWDNLVKKYENVKMVFSGHMESNLITMTQSVGVNGNTVSQFLIDGQDLDWYYNRNLDNGNPSDTKSPLGLVTIFYFDEDGRTVDVRYYSPIKDKYYHTVNQFEFDLDAEAEEFDYGWNGYEIVPSGSGTQADPYIIKNGGNLMWMSNQIISGGCIVSSTLTETNIGYFKGQYFKQVCDIDLNGCAIKPIGYEHQTETSQKLNVAAFAGNYDGGGYRIYNGRIASAKGHATYTSSNGYAGDALFGVIYGAKIENVTLDNVTVYSQGVTGGIVGRSAAPTNSNPAEDFNVIRNCKITNTCKLVAGFYPGNSVHNSVKYEDLVYQSGIVGGIIGQAWATTIENCVSDVEIEVDGYHSVAAGIAGEAGYNTKIDNCVFNGGITLLDNKSKIKQAFGGIVALVIGTGTTQVLWGYSNRTIYGTIRILNSANNGYFKYTGTDPLNQVTMIGGIVADAHFIGKKEYTRTSIVENCVNNAKLSAPASNAAVWIGGIVGHSSTYSSRQPLHVKNCTSVDVAEVGGSGTNEYRYDPNNTDTHTTTTYPTAGLAVIDDGGNMTAPSYTGFSLTLNRGVSVNVKFNVSEEYLAAYPNTKVTFSNGVEFDAIAGTNTYTVDLTPVNIGTKLTVKCGDRGMDIDVSVETYVNKVKALSASALGLTEAKYNELVTLADSIVTYGKAAAGKLDGNVTADFTGVGNVTEEGNIFVGLGATLSQSASAKLTVDTAKLDESYTLTITFGDKTIINNKPVMNYVKNGAISVTGIYAANYSDKITVTVYDGADAIAAISFTLNEYLNTLNAATGSTAVRNLIAATYNYGVAASKFAS